MRTGTANLPLHGGKCPAWLFTHMKALSRAIVEVILEEDGPDEVLRRLSHPYWFQALGCVVGFDWHSSGVTTTVCGALKEGLVEMGPHTGLFVAGGKGRTARQTPLEIMNHADRHGLSCSAEDLVYASKMSAKVDSAAVQDSYDIYHHCFFFTKDGHWAVIQQGMNEDLRQARRYHWLGDAVESFTTEPQAAICCDFTTDTLNLVANENENIREISTHLVQENPDRLLAEIKRLQESSLTLPTCHPIPRTGYLNKALYAAYDKHPQDFEALLNVSGVGAGTLRALCLVAEVAYGARPSFSDPVRYSFAHGGKDGFPFPVNEADIEQSYTTLGRALRKAKAGQWEQLDALRKLARWHSESVKVQASPIPPSPPQPANLEKSPVRQPGLFDL